MLREGTDWAAMQRKLNMQYGTQARYATPEGPSQRDLKALNLMRQGVPQSTAYNIVDGVVDYEINPNTGRVVYTNKATGEVREVPIAGGVERQPLDMPSLWRLTETRDVAGIVPWAREMVGKITGQVGWETGTVPTEARQMFRSAQNDLIRALTLNPRFPVAEIERIQRETNIDPGVFDSDTSLRARMRAVDDYLSYRLQNERRVANDPNMPEQMREDANRAANDIANFLQLMGVPEDEQGGPQIRSVPRTTGILPGSQGTPTVEITQPGGPPPEGVPADLWQAMTPSERSAWMEAGQ